LWDVLLRMTAKDPDDRFSDPAEVAAALAPFAEGHRLPQLIREVTATLPDAPTHGGAKSETLIAKSAESDTRPGRLGRPGPHWSVAKSLPAASRKNAWRAVSAALSLLAVAAIGWLAIQATGRRESVQLARQARGQSLQVAAGFAASEILKEINLRFDILSRLATDEELRRSMNQILQSPSDERLWKPLENWLGARKADHDRVAPADSWFVNDVRGVQVARSPRSEASRGGNYAHRDYFHGRGSDLAEDSPGLTPIVAPHLSAVYRSTSTGHLKVAFSVPIENGRSGKERGIVGVLAMSVDLGEFNVLQNDLPAGQQVVLIDLRPATIDGQTRRGLVLHHQARSAYDEGETPPWVGPELLEKIDQRLAGAQSSDPTTAGMVIEYNDEAMTGGDVFWGALKPVIDRPPDEPPRDTRWLVVVQEPVGRD
jgi:hypothetical protein